MTLVNTILQRLAEWRPGPGRHSLTVPDPGDGWSASVTADRVEEVGCLVWEMSVSRTAELAADEKAVRAWADRVAGRATGLLESLKVLEIDAGRREALLRSEEPARNGDEVFYYEVRLRGLGTASVRRFRASKQAAGREQVAFAVTREALAKLAADLAAEE